MIVLRVGNIYTEVVGDLTKEQFLGLRKSMSFRPEGYQFSPMFNRWVYRDGKKVARMWDGWRRLCWKNKKRTYFPTGLLSLASQYLREKNIPFEFRANRKKPDPNIDLSLCDSLVLRPYQDKTIQNCCKIGRGIIQAATGSGKTVIAAGIIARLQVRPFLFFVTSVDLLTQAKYELERFLRKNGSPTTVGQVGGGTIEFNDVTVMTVQTAVRVLGEKWDKKHKFDSDDTDDETPIEEHKEEILELVRTAKGSICDECISGDSLIITRNGVVKVKNLGNYIGKDILSYSNDSLVWSKITNFYPKGIKKTLIITLLSGDSITCTEDHPIMTNRGWIAAGNLKNKDLILSCANTDAAIELNSITEHSNPSFDIEGAPITNTSMSTTKVSPDRRINCLKQKNKQLWEPYWEIHRFLFRSQNTYDINYVGIESIRPGISTEVFDITVQDTHCFFANNILVHNCQHWRAETCQLVCKSLENAYYTFGCSATPWRDQGDDLVIQSCFGRKIVEISASTLIRQGFLIKPSIKIVHVLQKPSKLMTWQRIYQDRVTENKPYNGLIANIANEYIKNKRLVLILVQRIKHGKILEKLIDGSVFVSGNSPKSKREESIKHLKNKQIRCLISTVIFDEGIDVKPLDTVILCGQGKSRVRAMQRIGRIMRPYTDPITGRKKTKATAIDFSLDNEKYLSQHAKQREKMYRTEEEYDIEHITVDLTDAQ